jgi:TRAP-type C4-dicarboxylate transport system permease small subunit
MLVLKQLLERIIHGLFQMAVLLCLPVIASLVSYDVFARFFFNSPVQGMNELVAFMLLVFFLLGLPRVVIQGQLVSLKLSLPEQLPVIYHTVYSFISNALTFVCWMALYSLLIWQAYIYGFELWEFEETLESWSFPIWPISILMVLSFILLFVFMPIAWLQGGATKAQMGDSIAEEFIDE